MKTFRQRLLKVVFEVMRPFARSLLRVGIGYKEFSEIAKMAFVDVALSEYGIRGRTTNVSRVSVMTGLSRRDVARMRRRIAAVGPDELTVRSKAPDVLHFWQIDPDFLTTDGRARDIPFDGDGMTFRELVRRYAGDLPPGALLKELRRVGAITELSSELLRLEKSYFIPEAHEERLLLSLQRSVRGLLSTLAHNCNIERDTPGRIERIVYSESLTSDQIDLLRARLRARIELFTRELDSEFASLEREGNMRVSGAEGTEIVGVGVFYVEGDD